MITYGLINIHEYDLDTYLNRWNYMPWLLVVLRVEVGGVGLPLGWSLSWLAGVRRVPVAAAAAVAAVQFVFCASHIRLHVGVCSRHCCFRTLPWEATALDAHEWMPSRSVDSMAEKKWHGGVRLVWIGGCDVE